MKFEDYMLKQRLQVQMEVLKSRWLKPLIKRQSGTWLCTGLGVSATGYSPQAAYLAWQAGQRVSIYYANTQGVQQC